MKAQPRLSLGTLCATFALLLASPAAAGVETEPSRYASTIAQAKSMMMADSAAALNFAREAKALVREDSEAAAMERLTAQWLEGEALMRLNRANEAADTIETALAMASESFARDKIHADLLRSSASLKVRAGEFKDALERFELANDLYEGLGDTRSRAIVLQNIGSLYSNVRDFDRVLSYYRQAAEVFQDDGPLTLSAHNNIGNALKGLARYEEAEAEFGKALDVARSMKSPLLEARILTNLASTQVLRGATGEAKVTARTALDIALEHAPDWTPFIYGVQAQVALADGKIDPAGELIGRVFAGQSLESTDALFRDFHVTAAEVFASTGDQDSAAKHLAALRRLDDQASKFSL